MDVFAAGKDAGIADRIAAGTRQHVFTIEGPQQALHLHVGADLLQAEAQVGEGFIQFRLVDLAKTTAAASRQPGGRKLEAETLQQIEKPAEVAPQGHAAIAAGDLLHHRPHRAAAGFGDQLVELHIGQHAGVVALVDLGDRATPTLGQQTRQRTQPLLLALQGGDVHQGGDRLLGGGGLADRVQTARQQPALDLHQLAIDRPHHAIATVLVEFGAIDLRQGHIFVEVALPRRFHDRVHDLHAPGALAQLLVAAHQLTELLKASIEASVFSRGGEVADRGGIAASLGDRGLGRVVGGVVIKVWQGADQGIGIAGFAHAHLLAGHELERAVGAEMEHSIGAPHLLEVGVIGGETVMGAGAAGIQQPHRVAFVAEGGLHPHEHVAEVTAVDQQVGAIAVQVAGGLPPVLLQALRIGGEPLVFGHAHPVGDRQLWGSLQGLGVGEHRLHQRLGRAGHLLNVVALELHLLEHPED